MQKENWEALSVRARKCSVFDFNVVMYHCDSKESFSDIFKTYFYL